MSDITFSELMQAPVITRVVNKIQTPLSLFQRFFGRVSGNNMGASENIYGREAGWDIFDRTRQFAGARAPQTPPHRVTKKPMGHVSAQLMRAHESIIILAEEIFRHRAPGQNIASMPVDMMGQNHIRNQIQFMVQRFRNQREWVYSRMLRGGFNILPVGDNYTLQEYDASPSDGSYPINFQIPSANLSRMPLGSGGDILTNWGSTSADVIGQLLAINKAFTRIHGRGLKHIWINSSTLDNLLSNTGLQAVGGTANQIFNSWTGRPVTSEEGIPDAGFEVVFRAVPWVRFHVYDGVLSADGSTDGTSTSDTSLLIPDDYAYFLPDPDGMWEGLISGSELIGENVTSGGRMIQGFGNWATQIIDPLGYELKFLDNYLPVLYVPTCVGYGYVGS